MNSFSGSDINQHKIYGVMVGEVTNIQDPDKIGRVKVKIHDLYEDLETDWIRVVSLYAGKDRGNFFLPEVGDEVLISFKNGNIDTPFVIGSLWNLTDIPPEENSDGKNNIKMLKTRSGHTVTFDDTDGKENINVKTAKGIEIVLNDEKNVIEIKDAKGNSTLKLDGEGKKVNISGKASIEVASGGTKITIDGSKNQIDLKSDAKISMKSAQIEVKSSGTLDLKSDGMVNIKGSMVKIN